MNKNELTIEELEAGKTVNGEKVTPAMIFDGKTDVSSLRALLGTDIPIDKMTPPEGVSEDLVEAVKQPQVDTNIYDYAELAKRIKSMPVIQGVPTGIKKLDELLDGGFQPGELAVLSAPTKNGKTTFAQTVSYLQACRGYGSLWFTLEMSWQELTRKFMAMDIDGQAKDKPSELPIYYPIDNRGISVEWLEEQIIKAKAKFNIRVVVIDHLHFLIPMDGRNSNISFTVGAVVRAVKQIAVRQEVPIILICHTKKLDVNVTPDVNSVRDSSFIAQESDFTIVMWRERLKGARAAIGKESHDDADIYSDKTYLALEANRRNGKTKRLSLGMINGRFYDHDEYMRILHEPIAAYVNKKEEDALLEKMRKVSEEANAVEVGGQKVMF